MTIVPSFYVVKAHRTFLNVYSGDPNLVAAEICEKSVRVTVHDVDEGVFPNHIDGIPFEYVQTLEEAS